MRVFWKLNKAFVKEVVAELPEPKPHYNSVATMVRILEEKGFLNHHAFGKTFQYFPTVSEEKYKNLLVNSVVDIGRGIMLVGITGRSVKTSIPPLAPVFLENDAAIAAVTQADC